MNKISSSVAIVSCLLLANFGNKEEIDVPGRTKPAVNFKGTLATWKSDEIYKVENITLNREYKQIKFTPMPSAKYLDQKNNFILECPKDITIKMDFSEIAEISCPLKKNWKYKKSETEKQKNENQPKGVESCKDTEEFTEVIITLNNAQRTQKSYLIEADKKIFLDDVTQGTPKEMEIVLTAIKTLKIETYSKRDENKKCE